MLDVCISLESTCDLEKDTIEKYDLYIIDMDFEVDGKSFNSKTDDVVSSMLYEKMLQKKKTATSQINDYTYKEHFEKLLEQNKPIIHLALSGGLSATVDGARRVAEEINKSSKNKVYVIDSLCACSGQGILGIMIRDKSETCSSIEELVAYAEMIKNKIYHYFTVDSLTYLANGGRLNSKAAFIGNLLSIKPVMEMSKIGKLEVLHKVISRKKSISSIANMVINSVDENNEICFIAHANCIKDALLLKEKIEENSKTKPKIVNLGPVIGCHSGPGTLAVFFVGKGNR
jgi:DegV family protein with EDD domain